MEFIKNLSETEYRNYFNSCENAHFLQSYSWGQACQKNRKQIPYYVGVKENNKLIACALLLKKKTPLNMCYFYAPRGFVFDMKNKELLNFFTNSLKQFLKEENAIYLKVDPGIKYQTIDHDAKKVEGENNYELYNNMLQLGYEHTGFYKLYEGNQPRYTIRIDLTKTLEEINNDISKSFLKTVKKSHTYNIKVKTSNDIKTFSKLIDIISAKNGFSSYSYEYYQNFYDEFKKNKEVKVFEAIINPKEIIQENKDKIKQIKNDLKISSKRKKDLENMLKKYNNEIELFQNYQNIENLVVCSLICTYTKFGCWTLYIGNDNLGMKTNAVNRLYYEALLDAKENGYKFYDLFGTVGDPHTDYKNLAGLHEFKRKFGGEYLEFIGEFDLINKKFWYKILPILLKIYRKLRR